MNKLIHILISKRIKQIRQIKRIIKPACRQAGLINQLNLLTLFFIVLLLIIGLSLTRIESAPAPKSYTLKYNIKEGDRETIIYKLEASANVEVPSQGNKHPGIILYSRLEQEIDQKILKISDSQIARIERTYRSSKYFVSKTSQTPKAEPLDGRKITIESDGTITTTSPVSPEIKSLISINEHRFGLILPVDDVQIKSEWDVPGETVVKLFNFSNYKKRSTTHGCTDVGINAKFSEGTLKCLLKDVKYDNALIEMNVTLKGDDNGMTLDATLKGRGTFAIKKGKFTKIELTGEMTLEGMQPCQQPNMRDKATGTGKLSITYEFK